MRWHGFKLLGVLLLPGLATSCSWLSNSAAGTIATGAPADTADALNVDQFAEEFKPEKIKDCQKEPNSDAARRCRNDITNYRIRYYDANYYTFKRLVLAGNSAYNAGTD